jgi:hypothetical protein
MPTLPIILGLAWLLIGLGLARVAYAYVVEE